MSYVADLHLHSKYSRAVSQEMVLDKLFEWGKWKGINLIGTGDFTHPFWFHDLKEQLKEDGSGFLSLKDKEDGPKFLLTAEISNIYSQGGKGRRIHNVVFSPSLEDVEKINDQLSSFGNLMSDGRPILGISAKQLLETIKSVSPKSILIPAHVWTPWFSLYGSKSGFDSIEECFGSLSSEIIAIETGLSSDPAMNWRIKELDSRRIVSFSDAHSLSKLGREATVFDGDFSWEGLSKALGGEDNQNKIVFTVEFYPEEGKYHYTGHRECGVRHSPKETQERGAVCPVCNKKLTVGVMHRVEDLASRSENDLGVLKENLFTKSKELKRPPYVMLVPLQEIISEALEMGVNTKSVGDQYKSLVSQIGSEFKVLLKSTPEEITRTSSEKIAEGVMKARKGEINISPGFDGEFGKVSIWKKGEEIKPESDQMSLF